MRYSSFANNCIFSLCFSENAPNSVEFVETRWKSFIFSNERIVSFSFVGFDYMSWDN